MIKEQQQKRFKRKHDMIVLKIKEDKKIFSKMSTKGISFQEFIIMIQSLTILAQMTFRISMAAKDKNNGRI